MRITHGSTLLPVTLTFLLAACGGADTEAGAATDDALIATHIVEVTGSGFAFDAPDEIHSGWITFRFSDEGPEPHHITVVRLAEGQSADEVLAAMAEHRIADGATALGGPNTPGPGGVSEATLYLEPGRYLLLCAIPSPDGVPHAAKGMVHELTVLDEASTGAAPRADLEIDMRDYVYQLSQPIGAGSRTIRVNTAADATEPHDLVLVRLHEGKTLPDLGAWMQAMDGPPPADFLGGVTVLDPGNSVYITADFTPGNYVMLCPIASPDGVPHHAKGMVFPFTIE